MSEASSPTANYEEGPFVLLRAFNSISDGETLGKDELYVGYHTPTSVDEEIATVKLRAGVRSIHWPGKYSFTKTDMSICKKIIFAKRTPDGTTTTLYDLLLFLKNEFTKLDLEVRLIGGYDVDKKVVYNLEGVKKDGSELCHRFHITA